MFSKILQFNLHKINKIYEIKIFGQKIYYILLYCIELQFIQIIQKVYIFYSFFKLLLIPEIIYINIYQYQFFYTIEFYLTVNQLNFNHNDHFKYKKNFWTFMNK